MRRGTVDDDGDDYGLRGESSQSSTVIVAVVVHRNGRENGGEGFEALNPLQRQELHKKTGCQI
jgi:hypothetical protein